MSNLFITDLITQQETIGHTILVVVFLMVAVVFYSLILFTFCIGMNSLFSNLIKKYRYGKV